MIPLSEFLALPMANTLRQKKTGESIKDDLQTDTTSALLEENLQDWLDKTRKILSAKLGCEKVVFAKGVHPV